MRLLSLLVVFCELSFCQSSFWPSNPTPKVQQVTNDSASVTLGIQFRSDVAGTISAIRFYKGTRNTGTHIGNLWSNSGSKLATVTFAGESASGWQQASFPPVNINANTTYVVSYLAPRGRYADDQSFAWTSVIASPLHFYGSSPGVFAYGSSPRFPTGTWNGSNYWVDLVFTPATMVSYSISGIVSGSPATLTLTGGSTRPSTLIFGMAITNTDTSGNYSFPGVSNGTYVVTPTQPGITFSPTFLPVTVNGQPVASVDFLGLLSPVPHSATLTWTASASVGRPGIGTIRYNVYRASTAGGPYTKLTSTPLSALTYTDLSVSAGQTYFYSTTAVDGVNPESKLAIEVKTVIPQ